MSIVGFTLARGLPPERQAAAAEARRRALRHFPALASDSLQVGETTLDLWGHGDLSNRIHRAPDGAVSVLVGSPHEQIDWDVAAPRLEALAPQDRVKVPDGRSIVLRIEDGGRAWALWNDWTGSIPVYHAEVGGGRIASTLEPAVVRAAGFAPADIFLPALLWQLVHGFFLEDWTLFGGMRAVPSDSHAAWTASGYHWRRQNTVQPSEERWGLAWNQLVDEMYEVSLESIAAALRAEPAWVLLLSSGLDSRLIAAAGARLGTPLAAYTWGARDATDVVQGRALARVLGLEWRRVDVGTEYLVTCTRPWADLFGSSMHFHGMYQMQFFRQLRDLARGPVLSGYLGDVLSGSRNQVIVNQHAEPQNCQFDPDNFLHWNVGEATSLLKRGARDALAAMGERLRCTLDALPGAPFQKVTLLRLLNRQGRFTAFNTTVAHYEREVAAPFLSRDYARFCLSLPRAAVDRHLLADMFRRHYPTVAAVPGSYGPEPYLLTGRYLLGRRVSRRLPAVLQRGLFQGERYVPLRMDLECVRAHGWDALWPLQEAWERLDPWVDLGRVAAVAEEVIAGRGDLRALRRLQSIQCLAYRLLPEAA